MKVPDGFCFPLFSYEFQISAILRCKAVKKEETKEMDVDKKIRLEELRLRKAEVLKEYEALKAQRRHEEQSAKWNKVPWSKPSRWNTRGQTWHPSTWTQKSKNNDGCWTAHDEYLCSLNNDGAN